MEEKFKKRIEELLSQRQEFEQTLIRATRQGNVIGMDISFKEMDSIRLSLKELTNLNPMLANDIKKDFMESIK